MESVAHHPPSTQMGLPAWKLAKPCMFELSMEASSWRHETWRHQIIIQSLSSLQGLEDRVGHSKILIMVWSFKMRPHLGTHQKPSPENKGCSFGPGSPRILGVLCQTLGSKTKYQQEPGAERSIYIYLFHSDEVYVFSFFISVTRKVMIFQVIFFDKNTIILFPLPSCLG